MCVILYADDILQFLLSLSQLLHVLLGIAEFSYFIRNDDKRSRMPLGAHCDAECSFVALLYGASILWVR
jgi:hypothetical protein